MEYKTIAERCEARFIEKKSEFIGFLAPVSEEEEAVKFISEIRAGNPKARHNCYAYILRENNIARHSDDGEPQGTAGAPIYEVLRREGLTDIVCVVTRYFGGVLLGAGGLLRAYTKSAKDALDAAGISVVRRWVEAELPCSYSAAERRKPQVAAAGGVVTDTRYGASVTIRALVPVELAGDFCARITDATNGTVSAKLTGEALRAVPRT